MAKTPFVAVRFSNFWVFTLLVINLMLYELLFSDVGLIKYWKNETILAQYQARIKKFDGEILVLQQLIYSYQKDPDSLKVTLKDQFEWVGPNEMVFQFQEHPDKKQISSQ